MTPPKVEGAPKPTSSVRISRMFGAPSGGMICGGHAEVLSMAFGMIVPVNGGVGSGSTRLSGNSTAAGEPGVPRICWAGELQARAPSTAADTKRTPLNVLRLLILSSPRIRLGPSHAHGGSPTRAARFVIHVGRCLPGSVLPPYGSSMVTRCHGIGVG